MNTRYVIYANNWAGNRGYVAIQHGNRRPRRYQPSLASFERLGEIANRFYCARVTRARVAVEISERNRIPERG